MMCPSLLPDRGVEFECHPDHEEWEREENLGIEREGESTFSWVDFPFFKEEFHFNS